MKDLFQIPPLREGHLSRYNKKRPFRQEHAYGFFIGLQYCFMPYADCYDFILSAGRKLHGRHYLNRDISFVLLHCIRRGADTQQQYNLLDQLHHAILSIVSG